MIRALLSSRLKRLVLPAACCLVALPIARPPAAEPRDEIAARVRAAETAFAKTMADRDLEAFKTYVADEALFFGSKRVLRGRDAVATGWSAYFEGAEAPFSWAPETVEALDSGTLALSSGPVLDPSGKRIGTFNSIWRLDADGRWRVVFDKGCPPCECPPEAKGE